ncbi:MAG: EscU/YscU/HrcU family type III secretion system export apparatus switch protein [Verrucomicrobiae bacterium]|nr:EscU/YscU/HrcU family type III secretion system export apparatus switch protein [Verrucomicrobiae bacterium]
MFFDDSDKTEQATPKHRSESRQKGVVAKSMDINGTVIIIGGLVALTWFGPLIGRELIHFTQQAFLSARLVSSTTPYTGTSFASLALTLFGATGLWLGIVMALSLVAGFSQAGFEFTTEPLSPKWSNLNPLSGFQRLFSPANLVRSASALVKVTFLFFACKNKIIEAFSSDVFNRPSTPNELVNFLFETTLSIGWRFVTAMVVISAADYAYQRWQYEKNLRMTKDEVKDEGKQSETNPEVKKKIRGKMIEKFIQQLRKVRHMRFEVPKATVVVTNPTHVAVALRYDRNAMKAPKVVAKGVRLQAQEIKALARKHGVPIIENKPLARGLYRKCPLGAEIPSAFYQAVALVLAQVYRLSAKRQEQPGPAARRQPMSTLGTLVPPPHLKPSTPSTHAS